MGVVFFTDPAQHSLLSTSLNSHKSVIETFRWFYNVFICLQAAGGLVVILLNLKFLYTFMFTSHYCDFNVNCNL